MAVSRLQHIPGIGVNLIADRADRAADPDMLRLENLDTDLRPPPVAVEATRRAISDDAGNSYLPFEGHHELRRAAATHVGHLSGREYDPGRECVSVAGGLNGVLNTLLAVTEPGSEVVIADPIYAGLVNRIRLAGAIPRHVSMTPTPDGWRIDPAELACAIGPNTAAVLLMGPAMPTGAVIDQSHLEALAESLQRHKAWVIYDAAMERIRFDGRDPVHPAAHPGLTERVITIGIGIQGTAHDRLESRFGCTGANPCGHRSGRDDQRRMPGRNRSTSGSRGPVRARRRRRRQNRHPNVAKPLPGDP